MSTVADLPFNRLLGLETVASGEALLRLPSGEKYHNHLGTTVEWFVTRLPQP